MHSLALVLFVLVTLLGRIGGHNKLNEMHFDNEDIKGKQSKSQSQLDIPAVVIAPIAAGQPVAELSISLDDEELLKVPLRALDDNPAGSFWQRTKDTVSLWFE